MRRFIEGLESLGAPNSLIGHDKVVEMLLNQFRQKFRRVELADGNVLAVLEEADKLKFPIPNEVKGHKLVTVVFSSRGVAFCNQGNLSDEELGGLFSEIEKEEVDSKGWKGCIQDRGSDNLIMVNNSRGMGLYYDERKVEQVNDVLERKKKN